MFWQFLKCTLTEKLLLHHTNYYKMSNVKRLNNSCGTVYSTCIPDILSLDAFLKVNIWQLAIIPAVAVQIDTPWMDSGEKNISKSEARRWLEDTVVKQ